MWPIGTNVPVIIPKDFIFHMYYVLSARDVTIIVIYLIPHVLRRLLLLERLDSVL